jgi:uncharacterized OsmC-like protein
MPKKNVVVHLTQKDGFKIECKAGKHILYIDQPAEGGGSDAGPTPLDFQLMALGGCFATIAKIIALQRKLKIHGIELTVEGEINTDKLLGKSSPERTGFKKITVHVKIASDMTAEEKEQFIHEVDQRCPISDSLQNQTEISFMLLP